MVPCYCNFDIRLIIKGRLNRACVLDESSSLSGRYSKFVPDLERHGVKILLSNAGSSVSCRL